MVAGSSPVASTLKAVSASPNLVAVLDTNVLVDVLSCHDLLEAYDIHDAESLPLVYRRARARESLLLCMHLHDTWSDTLSLHEAVRVLEKCSPPEDKVSFARAFTETFIWFVGDDLLPNWEMHVPTTDGGEKGNAADRAYLELAKSRGLPLITNEGYTMDGLKDEKLRGDAKAASVPVFAPREFIEGKMNEALAIGAFLIRFTERAPAYLDRRRAMHGEDKTLDLLAHVYSLYRHILLGETEGRDKRVRVCLD